MESRTGSLEGAFNRAFNLRRENFGKQIRFYAPSFIKYETPQLRSHPQTFPAISITGPECSLNCGHCEGRILDGMIPAPTPTKLLALCRQLKGRGGVGCLVSGGCLPDGSVPLGKFTNTLKKVKEELGFTLVVHTGLIRDGRVAKGLAEAGVDAVLIDVLGADETIREICHLNATTADYAQSLRTLSEAGLPLVPHIVVGLHHGQLLGERRALEMISEAAPRALVVVAFMPLTGTRLAASPPPPPAAITQIILEARFLLPKTPIVLGCARPRGVERRTSDIEAVRAGVNAIAFPTEEVVEFSGRMGLEAEFSGVCCSQIYLDLPPSNPMGR